MSDSYRMTGIYIDSAALTRVMEIAREVDIYDSRREASDDSYEEITHFLCDYFERKEE
ncbi:hypothetical protein [Halomicrobium urmianum]|uniref:hypothetical protein n=1 Tax=Halomicrobium urmianum TaxID=1586233 RepID=UPI001CDA1A0D|nr:hypothetical protein [Halomicrobium urmianum]